MKRALLIATALLVVAPTVGAAEALQQSVPDKARKLAERGRQLHDRGDYPRAIAAFKEAYVIAPSPALLFNLAQAYRLQGNCEDASLMYKRFLDEDLPEANRAIAQTHLHTVERCIAKRSLGLPMDDHAAYLASAPAPAPSEALFVDGPPPGTRKKQLGTGLVIGGGVALAGALYFGIQAASDAAAVEEAVANGARWKDVADRDAAGHRHAGYAKVLGVGGALAAAGGVTLYVLGKREARAASFAVVPTKSGAQVTVGWRF